MRIPFKFFLPVSILLVLILLFSCGKKETSITPSEKQKFVKIEYLQGKVDVRDSKEDEWKSAEYDHSFSTSGQIKTYSKAIVILKFKTGDKLKINENTFLSLDSLDDNVKKPLKLTLDVGEIF
ncbi:MAG: hypothetical protein KKH98_11105, partial [Spirochaetes bacterium]|nr:hypothetical protein [Spirochaetota bacterium]